jgi:hypothetical protein
MEEQSRAETAWPTSRLAAVAAATLLSFLAGLAASRILFDLLFPKALWLGRPAPALLFAAIFALIGWLLWRRLDASLEAGADQQANSLEEKSSPPEDPDPISASNRAWTATVPFFPLALNLAYFLGLASQPAQGRFLFFTSLWLTVLLLARLVTRPATWRWLGFVLLLGYLLPIYLLTMGQSVGTADTFEFQVVIPRLGIVHPTGYPLYLLLSKPFTFLPLNSVAWRINLATALFGLAAVSLLYVLGWRLTGRPLLSLAAAALFGLTITFWSQSVEAEVYTLHALVVAAALLIMREIGDWRLEANIWGSGEQGAGGREQGAGSEERGAGSEEQVGGSEEQGARSKEQGATNNSQLTIDNSQLTILLAFVLGLGLTNHLTTLILIPPAVLTIVFAYRNRQLTIHNSQFTIHNSRVLLAVLLAFVVPLLLYAYLPLRWSAVNGEAMGFERFVDWVVGGRFRGALQLTAWLEDPTRYDIIGRIFFDNWPSFWTLLLIFVGAGYLLLWQWRFGLILLLTWLGYVFYALNYIVPDVAVFIIPAQMIMAIWWLAGIVAALDLVTLTPGVRRTGLAESVFLLAAILPLLVATAAQTLPQVDRSADDGRTRWAEAVLDLPLAGEAAILADSDKFPGLYYLQQAESIRPDLDIVLAPDEAAYRAELDARLAAGQAVLLARFLPGLEGTFHLRSVGPLTEVSGQPLDTTPAGIETSDVEFGPIQLLGHSLEAPSPYASDETAVTFYWAAAEPVEEVLHIYTRWAETGQDRNVRGQHPANNYYPTVAWKPGEVVADFHALPRPQVNERQELDLQVALAPSFTPAAELEWKTVASVPFEPADSLAQSLPLQAQVGSLLLDGVAFPDQLRSGAAFPVSISGLGEIPSQFAISLLPATSNQQPATDLQPPAPSPRSPSFTYTARPDSDLPPGHYDVVVSLPGQTARCGWLARSSAGCIVGQVEISGLPLPDGATNFEDKIALLAVDVPETEIRPGGELPLTLTWQALAPLEKDYTVFVQVLDSEDNIVGQVDSWPVQGTFPTGRWQPGEAVQDPYLVRLDAELEPGEYKLHVGLYLLETLRRLQVLDESGTAVDDKVIATGLSNNFN